MVVGIGDQKSNRGKDDGINSTNEEHDCRRGGPQIKGREGQETSSH